MLHFFSNLHVFGEGGDGGAGAGAAAGAAPDGQAAEQSGVQSPSPEGQRRLTKAERRARLEEQLAAEKAQAQQPKAEEAPAEKTLDEEFTELIKGKYKEPYGKAMKAGIDERFKNARNLEAELKKAQADIAERDELLAQFGRTQYNIQPGEDGKVDIAALRNAARKTSVEEYALENGVSEEFAEKQLAKEERFKEQAKKMEAMEAEQREREQYATWLRLRGAAQEAQNRFPDLDLDATVNDPRFARLLEVFPPAEAYSALHQNELLQRAMQHATDQTRQGVASSIQAGMSRPAEGGIGRSAPSTVVPNVNDKAWREAVKRDARRGIRREF